MARQREARARGVLSKERQSKLESIGFDFRVDKRCTRDDQDEEKWMSQYNRLVAYQRSNNNNNNGSAISSSLKQWISTQRSLYAIGKLQYGRIQLLNDIDFVWNKKERNDHDRWVQKYGKLKTFFDKEGHLEIPSSGSREDIGLFNWVNRQRHLFAANALSPERKELLDEIGFGSIVSDLPVRCDVDRHWKQNYEQLLAFQQANGHLKVPTTHGKLYYWLYDQRIAHAGNKLSSKRKALLDELGDWGADNKMAAKHCN